VAASVERQQVVLAQAVELDVLDDHHAIRGLGEERLVDHLAQVGAVTVREESERLRHTLGRLQQASRFASLAQLDEQIPHQTCDFCCVWLHAYSFTSRSAASSTVITSAK